MSLAKYFKKRNFKKTPEPKGNEQDHLSRKLSFVVQEHHASTLHYDFRLEVDGVLKSWAIPKGPSLDPSEHRLAVQTEDHPLDYQSFEGVIPEGNYGAGNVIIWDSGWYEARQGGLNDDEERRLRGELKKGHITFILHGKKLHGEFALIRMHGDEKHAWLIVKKEDAFASTRNIIEEQDTSVKSDRHVDDLGAYGKVPDLSHYPQVASPHHLRPMLCTLIDTPFDGKEWLFEIKWDGYRAVAHKKSHSVELYSRLDNDFSKKYPPIIEAMRAFTHDVIVDGEIVVVDDEGKAHFEWLQNWARDPRGTLRYYIFDITWCDGRDVRSMPLVARKTLLRAVLPRSDVLQFSDDIEEKGVALFKQMQQRSMEGIVAKRLDSTYQEDARGGDWLKAKTQLRQEVVIGGYTEPRGSRKHLGSLLVGTYEDGVFRYVGHSGGGISDEQRKLLRDMLVKYERETSAFQDAPPSTLVHWVRPMLVCEMSFSEWTKEGFMRQPKYEGLRPDKEPKNVHREKAKKGESASKSSAIPKKDRPPLEVTHLDKVFFPKHGYTKGDLINYYEAVAEYVLPYLKDRPCSMLRMPSGITGNSFFQKNNEHLPTWVASADIFSESHNGTLHWIVGGTLETLLYMVQLGCVEINPWSSRLDALDKPDWMVIDLDPEGVPFGGVIEVAHVVRAVCEEWGIPTYPKTSGKTGIHIFIPMQSKYDYEQVRNLAHLIVLEVHKRSPKLTSVERMPEKRKNKIYLDFLQNREGQTLAAAYSVRPTPDASVSTPLHWSEVTSDLRPSNFTIKNIPERLKKVGDLWAPTLGDGIDLVAILAKIEKS